MSKYGGYEENPLLARCGFRMVALYGGFDRAPFDQSSSEITAVAEKESP